MVNITAMAPIVLSSTPSYIDQLILTSNSGIIDHKFLESPIAVASIEWNSKIGVPADVWALISTAHITCSTCGLIRSHKSHNDHLKENNICR